MFNCVVKPPVCVKFEAVAFNGSLFKVNRFLVCKNAFEVSNVLKWVFQTHTLTKSRVKYFMKYLKFEELSEVHLLSSLCSITYCTNQAEKETIGKKKKVALL